MATIEAIDAIEEVFPKTFLANTPAEEPHRAITSLKPKLSITIAKTKSKDDISCFKKTKVRTSW